MVQKLLSANLADDFTLLNTCIQLQKLLSANLADDFTVLKYMYTVDIRQYKRYSLLLYKVYK